ncbi:MAG: hypothetical protein ACWGSQ_07830 [Longimicrobiales bacterium]
MELSSIVHLGPYRGRKDSRLRRTLALHGHDAEKSLILQQLWRALLLVGGDRGGIVWLDEYGPGVPHAFALLDLASDRPRRFFPAGAFSSAWEAGVPGLLDLPHAGEVVGPDRRGIRSVCAVSLGSDGPRSWFLYLDSLTPRPALSPDLAGDIMFIAGECASILLHRDLQEEHSAARPLSSSRAGSDRFAGWPILEDLEGLPGDEAANNRIATRFLVARVIRGLVDEDFVVDSASLAHQVRGVRKELASRDPTESEGRVWDRVLEAIETLDLDELLAAALEWGGVVEGMGHLGGAREIHGMAYELAVALGASGPAVDAARFMGRVSRKLTRWEDAIHWYGVAREVAEEAKNQAKLALVLAGLANAYRDRGNLPRVTTLAVDEGDRQIQAVAHHDLMTVEKLAGNLTAAVLHGWQAARHYESREGSLKAFFDLAGVLKESGEMSAAWDAYSVVAAQVESFDYRLLSLDGMAHIAALRGQEGRYEALRARVEEMNWREAAPLPKAQVLLYRGLSCNALGRTQEARGWLGQALAFAEKHKLSQLIFRAEAALREISSPVVASEAREAPPREDSGSEVLEVRRGLRRMREAVAGAGGPL